MKLKQNNNLTSFEKSLYKKGIKHIAGVDEVGRGPLAGPLVIGAVVINLERINYLLNNDITNNDVLDDLTDLYTQIDDSKKLTPFKRSYLNEFILKEALSYSIVELSHEYIDKEGISSATQYGFFKVINQLNIKPEHVLTDTFEIKKITAEHQTNIKRGDTLSISIAAASIIAKVYRDTLMEAFDKTYPQYGFAKHKGYGTANHIEAIRTYGICDIHRKSFEPIKSFIKTQTT